MGDSGDASRRATERRIARQKQEAALATQQQQQEKDAVVQAEVTRKTAMETDTEAGRKFGQQVLGDGLGRTTESTMQNLEGFAKGMDSKSMLAAREKGMEGITSGVQSQQRALQASLARTGVKGSSAGAAQAGVLQSGIQARGNLERDLMLQNRDMQLQGTQAVQEAERFDLSQAAKEKNILLQSGLGFAGLGAAERGAKLSADAQRAASAASSGGGK